MALVAVLLVFSEARHIKAVKRRNERPSSMVVSRKSFSKQARATQWLADCAKSFYPSTSLINFGCKQKLSRFRSISVLRKAFESFDSQKSGSISTETVAEILRLMGQPFNRQMLDEMIEEVDEDKSGRLEFEEFIILAAKFIVEDDEEARKWLMCLLDFPADAPANTTFLFH